MEYEILLLNIVRDAEFDNGFMDCIGPHIIAEYIRKKGFRGKVYSGTVKDIKQIIENEINKANINVIGFYIAADNKWVTINIIKWIKENFDVKTLVGGPEAAGVGIDFFKVSGCDYAIVGEGEESVSRFLSYIIDGYGKKEDIGGLVYIGKDGNIIKNPIGNFIEDLDSIPFPKMENSLNKSFRKSEMVGIITGRGCPFRCSFCYEGANSKVVRLRSISNVMQEIDYIADNNPNLKFINVYDDTFTLDFKRVISFCDEMKKRNIKWLCEGHISNMANNADMVKYMVDSGLVSIQFGIESGSAEVLKAYNKKITPEMTENVVRICKEAGVFCVSGNFIIGGVCETRKTIEESMAFAKRLIEIGKGMVDLRTVFLAPYVNTKISMQPDNFNLILDENELECQLTSMKSPVMFTNELSINDILKFKVEFDNFLKNEYTKQVMCSNKNDVVSAFFYKDKPLKLGNAWQIYYLQRENIKNFVKHYNSDDDILKYEKYIIRTFETFYDMDFENNEYDFLKYCNGKNNGYEILKKLHWEKDKFEKMYNTLRNKCMVYLSDF